VRAVLQALLRLCGMLLLSCQLVRDAINGIGHTRLPVVDVDKCLLQGQLLLFCIVLVIIATLG
jgi:hypothetical protein